MTTDIYCMTCRERPPAPSSHIWSQPRVAARDRFDCTCIRCMNPHTHMHRCAHTHAQVRTHAHRRLLTFTSYTRTQPISWHLTVGLTLNIQGLETSMLILDFKLQQHWWKLWLPLNILIHAWVVVMQVMECSAFDPDFTPQQQRKNRMNTEMLPLIDAHLHPDWSLFILNQTCQAILCPPSIHCYTPVTHTIC